MKAGALAAAMWAALLAIPAFGAEVRTDALTFALPPASALVWRGVSSEEAMGTQGLAMLYPAPNVGGLLAAIFTHAAIVQGARESERSAHQAAADKVLELHAETIASITPAWLLEAALAALNSIGPMRISALAEPAGDGLIVEMRPTYSLAADRRVVVLDNAIKIHNVRPAARILFENVVRVVASPREEEDPLGYWTADEGRALKQESAAILAHSIEVALKLSTAPASSTPFRTQRYRFGGQEKLERGQPLAFACNRVVLRTLREWLMSVPVAPAAEAKPCENAYRIDSSSLQ